jgi:hypothetical protein
MEFGIFNIKARRRIKIFEEIKKRSLRFTFFALVFYRNHFSWVMLIFKNQWKNNS